MNKSEQQFFQKKHPECFQKINKNKKKNTDDMASRKGIEYFINKNIKPTVYKKSQISPIYFAS